MKNSATFRFDYNPTMGFGHAIRCQSLAGKLKERGWKIQAIVSREDTAIFDPDLHKLNGFDGPVHIVPSTHSSLEKLEIVDCENAWLIVDGYHIDANLEKLSPAPNVQKIRFSDWPQDVMTCDVVIDLSSGASKSDYEQFMATHTSLLLGTDFFVPNADLEAFMAMQKTTRNVNSETLEINPVHLFVSFGYGDVFDACIDVLNCVAKHLQEFKKIDFALHEGTAAQLEDHIASHALTDRIELHPNCDYVYELMNKANLAIGACGMTAWERCALSLPTLATALSHDQENNFAKLVNRGAVMGYWHASSHDQNKPNLSMALSDLLGDKTQLRKMALAARSIIDGKGFERLIPYLEKSTRHF